MISEEQGERAYGWIKDLYKIPRYLIGSGVLETLNYIKKIIPELTIHTAKSGDVVFDWVVPQEWKLNRKSND